MSRPASLASVSLDLDNLWSYQKTHGDTDWERRGSYLGRFLPPVLDLLDELDLRITFFIVGLDADQAADNAALAGITARGHDVGNHSYEHEPWLHTYDGRRLAADIITAEGAIEAVTGVRPRGFRGPGYSWSPALFQLLAERGYTYDASTLPTWIGPLARHYYFRSARLNREERRERRDLFGGWRDGTRPVKPYRWDLDGAGLLLEIPVSTMPFFRVPFHLSYLLYLARISERLMTSYLRSAIAACRLARLQPSFLLHPLDLLGGDQVSELAFFPGMDLTGARKRELFRRVMGVLGRAFTLVSLDRHAATLRDTILPVRRPAWAWSTPAA
jgi:peptidoglycan/xylan/chitin deacetylase (PgdA/CDA1 family)